MLFPLFSRSLNLCVNFFGGTWNVPTLLLFFVEAIKESQNILMFPCVKGANTNFNWPWG